MSEREYLIIKLMEEAAELQQACSKALLFGLEDKRNENIPTNEENINLEFNDVLGVARMLGSYVDISEEEELIQKKIIKVTRYMEYSRDKRILE